MDVRRSKRQEPKTNTVIKSGRSQSWLAITYIIIALASLVVYFLTRFHAIGLPAKWDNTITRFALAVFFAFIALSATKFIELIILKRSHTKGIRYNLVRLIRFLGIILVGFVIVSFLFANWYTAAVSLGLTSLILGFALQTPISSLIGWLYIVMRAPYKVGDRIQL